MSAPTAVPSKLTRGYAIALVCAAILSTTAIFIRYLTQTYHLPPLVLAFWRDGFTAGSLFIVLLIFRRSLLTVEKEHRLYLLGYGFVLATFNALWTLSVALNGAAVSTVLVYTSGGFTALLAWWLLNERLGWAKLLAVAAIFAGCVLVAGVTRTSEWQANGPGIIVGVLSGLCYAGYSLMGRSASQRGLNPWTSLLYTFGFAALILLIVNMTGWQLVGAAARPADMFWLGGEWVGWAVLFLLAAGPTLLGFGLYNVSLGYLPSSVANLVVSLEPAITAVIAYFLLGERLTMKQILGGLIILGGVALLRLYEGKSGSGHSQSLNLESLEKGSRDTTSWHSGPGREFLTISALFDRLEPTRPWR